MGVPSVTDIISMGFIFQMFGFPSEAELKLAVKSLIAEHGAILSGRIGSTAYSGTTEPTATYVKRALKCLVAADLCQMRINRLAQDIKQDDGTDALKLRRQRADYLAEAELLTGKIEVSAGSGNDFATGTVITSHFSEDA